jgi:hypothetical protein
MTLCPPHESICDITTHPPGVKSSLFCCFPARGDITTAHLHKTKLLKEKLQRRPVYFFSDAKNIPNSGKFSFLVAFNVLYEIVEVPVMASCV